MSRHAVRTLKNYVRRVSDAAALQADAQLLEQFIEANDPQAFEALLQRHGPMVLGTARRLLARPADADDVFQAVFLSLARLAKTIRRGQSIPSWLYRATCRIAARARQRQAISLEQALEPRTASTAETELLWREVRAALDEELQRLPERLRSPVLLCYLSGLTRDEAAQQLGWSLSTLKRRLEEGRGTLRRRLERRGFSSAGLLLAVLSPATLDAEIRPTLADACLEALSGRESAASVSALLLSTTTNLKSLVMKAVIVSLALTSLGIGIYASFGRADPPKPVEEKDLSRSPATRRRVDSLGDPLPPGAMMRLGTRRHRAHLYHPALPFHWQYRPDGKSYLVQHSDGIASEIQRIDARTGAKVETWPVPKSHGDLAWAGKDDRLIGFSLDGRYALLTNDYIHHGVVDSPQEWHLTLYDLSERQPRWSVSRKLGPQDWPDLSMCVFSANAKWFITNEARVWDAETGKQLWEHRDPGQPLLPVGFIDGDDTVVLRGDNDGTVYLFDRARGTEKKSFATAPRESWGQTLLSPDGQYLVICTLQPPSIWDWNGRKVATLEGHEKWANVAAFSPDGKRLFTGCFDSFVIEREFPSGKPIRKFDLGRDRVMKMAVSPDGKRLEAVFEGEQALLFYDLASGKQLPEPIASHRATIYGVECAPDGSLISFGADRSVHTWDLEQGKSVAQLSVDLDLNGRGFALSADGTRIAVPNGDVKSIGIYERRTGKRLRNIVVEQWFSGQQLAFSPDGRFLASIVGSRRSVQVWEVATGAVVLKVSAANACNTVAGAFNPQGRDFAFGDGEQVRIWDTATWKEKPGMRVVAPWWLKCLEYSPDGRMIATASEFGQDGVRLYEVATRRERAHVQSHGKNTGAVRFSHDSRLLAWANSSNQIHVLDVRTGALAGPFTGHDGAITGLTFTIGDKALASSSEDCTILVWDVSATTVVRRAGDDKSEEDWQALRGEDAPKAFAAMRRLAAHPEAAWKTIGEHLKPIAPIDSQWAAARLRALDHEKFAEREQAQRELEGAGEGAGAALEKFLATVPSAEARQRAESILAKIRGREATGETAQALRALEVLEWLGTARARAVVANVAQGAEGVSVTEEAKACLKRWK